MGKVYVCSDIHGDWIKYENAIKALKQDDALYILGDATDRGPYGIKILQDIIRRRERTQGPKIEYVLGNHDYMLLHFMDVLSKNRIFQYGKFENFNGWSQRDKRNIEWNGCKITIQNVMNMSEQEHKKLREFLENSYVQVVLNEKNEAKKRMLNVVLTHSVPPVPVGKSYTLNQVKQRRYEFGDDVERICNESSWKRPTEGAEEEWRKWRQFFTICGHTSSTSGMMQYMPDYKVLDIDTSKHVVSPLLCLNNGRVQPLYGDEQLYYFSNNGMENKVERGYDSGVIINSPISKTIWRGIDFENINVIPCSEPLKEINIPPDALNALIRRIENLIRAWRNVETEDEYIDRMQKENEDMQKVSYSVKAHRIMREQTITVSRLFSILIAAQNLSLPEETNYLAEVVKQPIIFEKIKSMRAKNIDILIEKKAMENPRYGNLNEKGFPLNYQLTPGEEKRLRAIEFKGGNR